MLWWLPAVFVAVFAAAFAAAFVAVFVAAFVAVVSVTMVRVAIFSFVGVMVRVVLFSFIGVRVGATSTTSSSLPSLSYGQGLRLKPPTQDGEGRGLKKKERPGYGGPGAARGLGHGPMRNVDLFAQPDCRDNNMFNAASSAWRVSCCVATASRSGAAVCPTADLSDGAVCSTISISGAGVCPTAPAGGGSASRRGGYVSLASPSGG